MKKKRVPQSKSNFKLVIISIILNKYLLNAKTGLTWVLKQGRGPRQEELHKKN